MARAAYNTRHLCSLLPPSVCLPVCVNVFRCTGCVKCRGVILLCIETRWRKILNSKHSWQSNMKYMWLNRSEKYMCSKIYRKDLNINRSVFEAQNFIGWEMLCFRPLSLLVVMQLCIFCIKPTNTYQIQLDWIAVGGIPLDFSHED